MEVKELSLLLLGFQVPRQDALQGGLGIVGGGRWVTMEEQDGDVPKKGMTIFSFFPTTFLGFLFSDSL